MAKNKGSIKVSFPWASAEGVAGSQVLIEFGKEKKRSILVECGLIQGDSTVLKEYQSNKKKFAFKSKNIDYVFCCHMHSDHIGLIPRLYSEGCEAPIIMPTGSKAIFKQMLIDSGKIMEKNAEYLTRKFKKEYYPIYTQEDVLNCLEYAKEFERHTKYELDEHITFEFINSGHIINSTQLILWITCNNSTKKIVITSDLGNTTCSQYYTDEFEPAKSANLLIGETTYCNPKRSIKPKDREKDLEKLKAAINTTCGDRHGNVLIPAFSLQRFQQMLTHIYDLFKDDPDCPMIYAASPLACKISDLYDTELRNEEQRKKWLEVRNWEKIEFIRDYEALELHMKQNIPSVYVASAGMLISGYSLALAKYMLPRATDMIIFCGFMAPNTIGYKIKQNDTAIIIIEGEKYAARCNVMALNSFSSHMMHDNLLKYYSQGDFTKIALVHGELEDKIKFAHELQWEISKKDKTNKVICVNRGTSITLS